MNKEETNITQLLTGKPDLEQVTIEELQQLVTTHPYFAAAQLLLAKKMQQVNHEGLQQQLQKTALFFPNEQWLRYLLSDFDVKKNDTPEQETLQEKSSANNGTGLHTATANRQTPVVAEKITTVAEKTSASRSEYEDKNLITLPAEEVLEQMSDLPAIDDEPEIMPLDEEELMQQSEPLPLEESSQKIAGILQEQAEEFHKPITEEDEIRVETEPFHTIDYFASQGIQLDKQQQDNLDNQDSLDNKVHKFTDWLRQMKRIHPQPVDLGTDAETESLIETIAANSNQTKEIITESMAEVLLKQDKKEKAIEIYKKLSLLYPAKTAYFAAKIEHLQK